MKCVKKIKQEKPDRQVEMRPIPSLKPYPKNARIHTPAQIAQIAASITEFGWTNPVLIDDKGGIIAGHARVEAAKTLQLTEVPTIRLSGLTEAQARAYIIADNRLALNAEWDEELLGLELADLKGMDFDLELIGFDEEELEKLFAVPAEKPQAMAIQKSADLTSLAPSDEERKILEGRTLLVEFSGGKDSSAVAVWTKHYFPEAKILLCYVDLGAEYEGFFFHLRRLSEALGCELKVLRSSVNIIAEFLNRGKWPHFGGPYCHEFLHMPMHAMMRSIGVDLVADIRGGRAKERAGKTKARTSRYLVDDGMKGYIFFQPLYFTTKEAAEKIVLDNGLPIWEGYDSGLQRTACRVCPGQKPATYAAIRANYPAVWEELLELDRRFGPGCWQVYHESGIHFTCTEMADKGQAAFLEGISRRST